MSAWASAPHHPDTPLPPESRLGAELVVVIGVVLGAASWGGWLGWDHTASYDRITHTVQDPYVTLQVLGCALTVGLAAAVLGALRHPVVGAGGVALGFWLPWTAWAVSRDTDGLAAVGAVFLALGLALGTALAACVGLGAGTLVRALARRRRPRDAGRGHRLPAAGA